MKHYKGICVKVYLKSQDFSDVAKWAEKAGKRRMGLLLFTQKKNGMAEEKLANTDGLSAYFKLCHDSYKAGEAERTVKLAEIQKKEKELEAEKAKLGLQWRT